MDQMNGSFVAQDAIGNTVLLEWQIIQGKSDFLTDKIKNVSDILTAAYSKTEVDFAQKKPELVDQDFMLKTLAPLLEKGVHSVDWTEFEVQTVCVLKQFFGTMDWAQYADADDINIFVVAVDKKTNKRLGVIQFLISSKFELHNVKAALYGVFPSYQGRGIEQLLMSSIFVLRQDVTRIFLHTRSTNTHAISLYKSWGFTEFQGKISHWTDLEYCVESTHALQEVAQMIVKQD